ncbi:uncharacterized protein K460DRAFT_368964 [Cucurbitaria berberidis CBS 394.84]|uniref:Uncharacterized protein n=1 Tax=Cucurbitaria berberidis CBS 394.84 TaxID=1168544 RepID=A0A9P4GF50_9PLEO|nr:uncharacterized protein K460DRAFT_368964 [Cucurbitaria berberidis CBS 394.84]KAF1844089.1 hypothetical protein K460DRAFT_368964 [Cucurbitaria berberidis CBS 394.84]
MLNSRDTKHHSPQLHAGGSACNFDWGRALYIQALVKGFAYVTVACSIDYNAWTSGRVR